MTVLSSAGSGAAGPALTAAARIRLHAVFPDAAFSGGTMMNITSPRRAGHRVLRRAARPHFGLQPASRLPLQTPTPSPPARPPTLWQRLRQWLWPRLTPEQLHARSLRRRSADLRPRVVVVGGHPFLLPPSGPVHAHTRRAQSDLP